MWKFLLICALAVSVQGRWLENAPSAEKELLNYARALLELRTKTDDPATGETDSSINQAGAESMKTIEDIIREKYGELFTTMAPDIKNGLSLSEPIAYVINQLSSHRSSIVPCMDVAQLIGAVRFTMVSDMQQGRYYTLRGALEKTMMKTGQMIDLDQSLLRNIGHAILKPVFDALEELECDLGIAADCPAQVSALLPRPSPMEKLFWDTKAYMDNVDFKNIDVGSVIAGVLGDVWMKILHEKFTSTYTCKADIEHVALNKLGGAVESFLSLKTALSYDDLKKRLGSVISDAEFVDSLADILIQSHFVENYQAMRDLKQLIEESKTKGLQAATSNLNGFVLSLMYESRRDEGLFDFVLKDVMSVIDADYMNKPLHEMPVDDMIKVSTTALQSVMRHWKTPCLNARLVGMLAGFVEMQKVEAMRNERINGWYTNLVKEVGLSIMDTEARTAFEKILDITLKQPFKPFVAHVLSVAGPQPTELTLIELYQALSRRPETETVRDGVYTFLATVVPLLRHEEGEHGVFKCEMGRDDFLAMLQQAYGIVDSFRNPNTLIAEIQDVLTRLPVPSSIPQENIKTLATTLMNELQHEVLKGMLSKLALLEGVTAENAIERLTTYLAANLGYSIKYVVEQNTNINVPVSNRDIVGQINTPVSVPDFPTNPTEFVAWQQKLMSNFVTQYMTGLMHYNMVATKQIDICSAMPQLCNTLPLALSKSTSGQMN